MGNNTSLFAFKPVKNVPFCVQKANFVNIMGKPRYKHSPPRAIVQKREPATLFVTLPKQIVKEWNVHSGQIVEFSTLVEGQETFLKVKKICP
jgi:hypothetical protein